MNDNKPNDRHHGEQPISEPLMSMEEALAKCSALPLPEECSFIALAERMDAEQQILQQTAEYKAFVRDRERQRQAAAQQAAEVRKLRYQNEVLKEFVGVLLSDKWGLRGNGGTH